jgi:hypothetical protein
MFLHPAHSQYHIDSLTIQDNQTSLVYSSRKAERKDGGGGVRSSGRACSGLPSVVAREQGRRGGVRSGWAMIGPCTKAWAGRGKEGAGPCAKQQC